MKSVKFTVVLLMMIISVSACKKTDENNVITIAKEIIIDDGLATSFDYRTQGIITPAKNQGPYGSCGVFAAMGVFEALIAIETGEKVDLSEQHYINASDSWNPNTGVSPMTVFQFMIDTGIVYESRLPYQATITNNLPEGAVDYTLDSYAVIDLAPLTADQSRKLIKQTLIDHGPLAAAMDFVRDLDNYQGGIFSPPANAPVTGGHWVVIVGWKDDPAVPHGGYWIVKNSDGPNWGENGCFYSPYTICNVDRYVIVRAKYKK